MLTNCFPIDNAPECKSSMEACGGLGGGRGTQKLVQMRHHWRTINVRTRCPNTASSLCPIACYCRPTPVGHPLCFSTHLEKKSFSQKSSDCFPSLHFNILTIHERLLYWHRTRPLLGMDRREVGHVEDKWTFFWGQKTSVSHKWPRRAAALLVVLGCLLVSRGVNYIRGKNTVSQPLFQTTYEHLSPKIWPDLSTRHQKKNLISHRACATFKIIA